MKPMLAVTSCVVALSLPLRTAAARPQNADPASLTQEEADRLRDAQDPSQRIAVYIELSGERLERFNAIRSAPPDPSVTNRGSTLDSLLSQYIALDDELKRWIQDQYDAGHDVRKGLRTLIDEEPKQLAILNQAHQTPDRYHDDYAQGLTDAIADVTDTLNGATQALAGQDKKFSAVEREQRADAKAAKQAAEDEKKRQKEERKLRKKEEHKGSSDDRDQNE
jgi:hypothetical protein